jgi:hypothetical protein
METTARCAKSVDNAGEWGGITCLSSTAIADEDELKGGNLLSHGCVFVGLNAK